MAFPNLIEQCRIYIAANGGHSVVAPSIGVTPAVSEQICQGTIRPTTQFAVGMAPLIGANAPQILSADSDFQLLTRRGAIS